MAIFRRDIFDEIRDDHRQVMDIFDQLLQTDEVTVRRRPQLMNQLQRELLAHMAAEETVFYPLLENGERNHWNHLHAEEEHVSARIVMERLQQMNPNEEHFAPLCDVLRNVIRLHVAEEESILFLTVRSHISNQQTIDLIQTFQAAKDAFRRQQMPAPKAA